MIFRVKQEKIETPTANIISVTSFISQSTNNKQKSCKFFCCINAFHANRSACKLLAATTVSSNCHLQKALTAKKATYNILTAKTKI